MIIKNNIGLFQYETLNLEKESFLKSILGLEIKGVSSGYAIFNSLGENSGIEVVEATPQPNGLFLIILQGKSQELFKIKKNLDGDKKYEKILFIEEPCDDLLTSLYSLNVIPSSEAFVIVETRSTLDSLELADLLQERGCEIVEIKSFRSQLSYSYFVAAGKKEKIALVSSELKEREPFKSQIVEVQNVLEPSEIFKKWFS